MESVGQKLRGARLRLGFTLDDVSARTRINLKNLQAIETDDLKQISSPFLYKSFVRQFAGSVALDCAALQEALCAAAGSMPQPLVPGQDGAPVRPKVPGLRPQRIRKLRWLLSIASLIVMLVACSSFYGMWQESRYDLQSSLSGLVKSLQSSPNVTASHSKNRQVSESRPPSPPTSAPAVDAGKADANLDGFRIQLSALETTWLSVMTDGKEVYEGLLKADESKTLNGRETARIRTGNAGGVEVFFNGRTIGPLGREGQVRTVVFTKNGYEVLEPQAHIAAMALFTPGGE
jgi:cytoskeleton protein RodZ